MEQVNDGGPAFPTSRVNINGEVVPDEDGMTLRDYFAAKAMQGFCASFANVATKDTRGFIVDMPRIAYEFADAMLKAREANHG